MTNRQELIAAYTATRFEAETPNGMIVLRIGATNAALAGLLERAAVDCAGYLTAWNPGSVPQSAERNANAHRRLLHEIESRACPYYSGYGRDPTGVWPPEHSLLVLGLSLEETCELGRRFGQAAVVAVDAAATPRLVWLGLADR
ncbi:MAG TPA: DUF3293 domain-containing protein [Steroidobacteraceae bacterium]|nr:DUF3293 domain-containing protein [Steroidobacteraceae bacterium]